VVRSQDVTESICAFWESIPLSRHLGIRVEEMTDGRSRLRLSVRPELCNPASSSVHGGALSSLVAEGHVLRLGRTLAVVEADVRTDGGELVVEGRGTSKVWRS